MQAIDDKILTLAHGMADTAGGIARKYFCAGLPIEHKADASPVTQADREIEAALRKLIETAYPDGGIIGEEFGNVRPDSSFQWVLDPIDGTRAFIAGETTFTTLIALLKDGIPILGLIDQPITKERWLGITGKKTTLNGTIVSSRPCAALSQARIATTSADYFTPQQAENFVALEKQCHEFTSGGDAYLYALLASGKMDIVVDASLKPYDFCALAPVVEGAGGIITDWKGKPLTLTSDGCVIAAASKELHAQALTILQAAV